MPSQGPPGTITPATAGHEGDPLLGLACRVTAACPTPALVVEQGGRLRAVNRAAAKLLELGDDLAGRSARSLFGLGWRELELIAREGDADLLTDMPGHSGRRGMRVRLEPVTGGGEIRGVVAFLEPAAGTSAGRPPRTSGSGFDTLFGHDPVMEAAKQAARRFAGTLLPVLLLAETGTGKELLARALHTSSPRRDQPFVAINCGALSPHLLESELFGYAPGAFTGASSKGHDGKIGAARGGTLFLDEVAEMPGPLQALLLRVLEDGTYYRVGESLPRQADVRLVCATCRDLPRLVAAGGFRQDLYYRINGACLSLPPVRQRSDLRELIYHLFAELAAELDLVAPPPISAAAFERMLTYSWPGNVRQLKTALRHGLILSESNTLGLEHLPGEVNGRLPGLPPAPATAGNDLEARAPDSGEAAVPMPRASAPPPEPVPCRTLHELEAERLRGAVEICGGNLTRAARQLGIARTTLYRRLRKHGFLPAPGLP